MKNKYKFDPNSQNQLRKRAKEQKKKNLIENGKSQGLNKKTSNILTKKKIVLKKIANKNHFQNAIQSQIQKSSFIEALSESLNPFTANTVTEAILSLYQSEVEGSHELTTSVGSGNFRFSQLDMLQLWSFIGEWCFEVSNVIWLKYQSLLVQKYKSTHDVRIISCLVQAYYSQEPEAQTWCNEALEFIFSQTTEKYDIYIAESMLQILKLRNRDLTHFISTFLKNKSELYTISASKRDWIRLFTILNLSIIYLPSNDVIYFTKTLLKHLLQNSPAEVQQIALNVFDFLIKNGLSQDESIKSPIPIQSYFQITQNLLKCKLNHESQIGSTTIQFYCKVVKDATLRLYQVDSNRCIQEILPTFFLKMLQYTRVAESNPRNDAVANVACKSIEDIVDKCFTSDMITFTVQSLSQPNFEGNIITNLILAIEGTFSVEFKSQFPRILQMIQILFEKFGKFSFQLLRNILLKVDDLFRLNDESLEFYIERTFGAAAKYMGVEAFLQILPIGTRPDPRLWMFRVLRSRIVNNSFRLYQSEFFSKIKNIEKKIIKAQNSGDQAEVNRFMNMNDEIWSLMIDFLVYPIDFDEALMKELVQMWVNIFKSIPRRRSIACRSLMRLIQTNIEYLQYAAGEELAKDATIRNFSDAVTNYSVSMAKDVLNLVASQSEILFPALFTLFTTVSLQNDVSLRDLVSVTITSLASVADKSLVSNFFKMILLRLLKSGQETEDEHQKQRLIYLDLAGAISPYLNIEMSFNFYSVLKPMLTTFDRPLQKKSNKALMHMCSKNHVLVKTHGSEILDYLCSILSQCDPAAKKYRLATLDALVVEVAPEAVQKNISHMIGEGLISAKEISSEARENAIDFLESLFKRVTFGSTSINISEIDATQELVTAACNFMRALISGLGGTSVEMISATIDVITHLLHNYLVFFEPVIENLFSTISLLLEYPNITVALSCFKFLKTCFGDLEAEFLEPKLRALVPSIFNAINRHSRALTKGRHLLERMTIVFGADVIENLTPTEHKKLIRNIQREMRREERKKEHSDKSTTKKESVKVDDELNLKATVMHDDNEEKEDEEMKNILDGKDEEITIEKNGKIEVKLGGGKRKREEVNLDDFKETEKESSDEEVEVFESRKRLRVSENAKSTAEDPNSSDPHAKHYLEIRAKQKQRRDPSQKISMGREFKSKKSRGDIKKGNMDPYAYLPLDPNQMNRRNRRKDTVFDKFSQETKRK